MRKMAFEPAVAQPGKLPDIGAAASHDVVQDDPPVAFLCRSDEAPESLVAAEPLNEHQGALGARVPATVTLLGRSLSVMARTSVDFRGDGRARRPVLAPNVTIMLPTAQR